MILRVTRWKMTVMLHPSYGDSQSSTSSDSSSDSSSEGGVGSGSDNAVGSDPEYVGGAAAEELGDLVFPFVHGEFIVKIDDFAHKERDTRSHSRLVCRCTSGHKDCKKRRGRGDRMTSKLGPYEPVAYLYAWSKGDYIDKAGHKCFRPQEWQILEAFLELQDAGCFASVIPG